MSKLITRPPIVVVMGHIDHGKSTLLDYIRKTNIVEEEAGGITQHMSAYEVVKDTEMGERLITFIDTPGHEAFGSLRARGASVADIAILVVSAEDGVKPQTLDALKCITSSKTPYIVAINKIDKPNADIERTKQSLAENEIYLEGYGGSIPWVAISAKAGTGVDELLDLVLLQADLEELTGDMSIKASGYILEANSHKTKGVGATLIITNGSLKVGTFVATENAFAPVRLIENFAGKKIPIATFSSPVRITGWTELPIVGGEFGTVTSKREAEDFVAEQTALTKHKKISNKCATEDETSENEIKVTIPIIIKADVAGTIEAIRHEIEKIHVDRVDFKILSTNVGDIGENDLKLAGGARNSLIIGFNVKVDAQASAIAERTQTKIGIFNIIYKVTEWLDEIAKSEKPTVFADRITGRAKILKKFAQSKREQVIGARVEEGTIKNKSSVKIIRNENEIGSGDISELQHMKEKVGEIEAVKEFGVKINSNTEIMPGDYILQIEKVEI